MSKSFQGLAGALLLLLAAGMGYLAIDNPGGPNARLVLRIAGGLGGVGLLLLALGMRNPLRPQDRSVVRRVFAPGNVAGGLVIAAVGAGVLWLFFNLVNVMPRIVVIGAILAIPAGLLVAAQIFENACAACGARLRSARPGGRSVEYCPGCGAVAVVFEKGGPVVLRGDAAHALAEDAKASAADEKDGAAAEPAAPGTRQAPPPAAPAARQASPPAARPARAALDRPAPPRGSGARPNLAAGIVCLLLGLGAAGYGVHALRARAALQRLWDGGAHARSATLDGTVSATRVFGVTVIPFYTYHLDVQYVDAAGAPHVARERVDSLWEELRPEVAQVVRHDPADPTVFVSSWAASFTYGPRISDALGFVVAAVLVAAGVQLLRARPGPGRGARREA